MAADTRSTKIVTYELQGNTTNLMQEITAALKTLDTLDQKLTEVSSTARLIGGKDKTNLARAATISTAESQIAQLRTTLTQPGLTAVSPDQLNLIKQMGVELDKTLSSLNSFKNNTTITQKALDKAQVSLHGMNLALRRAKIELDNVKTAAQKAAEAWNAFVAAVRKITVAITVIKRVISLFREFYDAAADYVETMNLFNVATQKSTESLYGFSEAMSEAYRADPKNILNAVAVFRQYANTMGFASKEADLLSENLTKLNYDLASLYNTSYTDMFAALRSGLAGQTKPLMRYGISVHKATLEQYALQAGVNKSWNEMTEADKVALRYIAILNQASLAQGDLARTIESPSNQMKIATDQIQILIRNLGALVTIGAKFLLPVFNGLTIALNSFLSVLAKAAGYEIEDYSDNLSSANGLLEDMTDDAEDTQDALKGLLAPLDEINQQNPKTNESAFGGIDPKILEALEGYDNLMDRITSKTDAFAKVFENVWSSELAQGIGSVLGAGFDVFGKAVDIATDALNTFSPVLNTALTLLGYILEGAGWLLDNVAMPVMSFIETLTSNIWLLIGAFTALNLMQLAVTGEWQSMMAVKIIQWFDTLTGKIWANITALVAQAAQAIKNKVASVALAIAIWAETAAWWQKAIAVIAAAGTMALVVGGIVLTATAAAKSNASNTMHDNMGVPAMATGGVVDQPTFALLGEGRYNEAVVPLGKSPQFMSMKEDIADMVARKITQSPTGLFGQQSRAGSNTPVILQIDGKTIARTLLPNLGYAQPQTGVRLTK